MKNQSPNIYGGRDPREVPAYNVTEAAGYLRLAPATLRSWVAGRSYPRGDETAFFEVLIQPADPIAKKLSFWNLIEAHVLRALRTEHAVSVKSVRAALDYAQSELGIDHLLLSQEISTGAGEIFIKKYGELINLSRSGQIAIEKVLKDHLKRVEWDANKLPARLFPLVSSSYPECSRLIVIDPVIAFGRPVIQSRGVSTATIAARIDAGESIAEVAKDYDLEVSDIEEAIVYERAA